MKNNPQSTTNPDFLAKLRDSFSDNTIFDTALTHRSWINEHPGIRQHNERLEFLGDAVLQLAVSTHLFNNFPEEKEGFMTNLRSNLVNTVNLAKMAQRLNLGEYIFLSKGEEDGGGRTNSSVLADSIEALIGAIYLDLGMEFAQKFINDHLLPQIDEKLTLPLKDPKSRFQELVQARGLTTPKYKVIKEVGPDHDKQFTIVVSVAGKIIAQGEGKNKLAAQQQAAAVALEVWEA